MALARDWAGAWYAESIVDPSGNRGVGGVGLVMGQWRGRRGADNGRRSDWIGPVVVGAYRTRIVRPIVGIAGRVRGVGAVDRCTVGLVAVPWTDAGPARSDAAAHGDGYGTAAEGACLESRRGTHDRSGEQQGGADGPRR